MPDDGRPLISFVVAMTPARVMGRGNRLPWHIPADLAHFRRLTIGKPVVMGRRTFESIGRPLPERHNIVVTRERGYAAEGCTVVHDVETALAAAGLVPEIAVIGGAAIFRQLLPRADLLHVTFVHADIDGDTHFPPLDPDHWVELDRTEKSVGPGTAYPLSFVTFRRRAGPGAATTASR
jgi:dihydrofolate reductase